MKIDLSTQCHKEYYILDILYTFPYHVRPVHFGMTVIHSLLVTMSRKVYQRVSNFSFFKNYGRNISYRHPRLYWHPSYLYLALENRLCSQGASPWGVEWILVGWRQLQQEHLIGLPAPGPSYPPIVKRRVFVASPFTSSLFRPFFALRRGEVIASGDS